MLEKPIRELKWAFCFPLYCPLKNATLTQQSQSECYRVNQDNLDIWNTAQLISQPTMSAMFS